jgi:cytochrome oxidase Cu insertion factor (SCO1/SenC/PrrC family)
VSPEPDSLIYEYNWMIALGRNDPEMEKYLVGYFIDHYMYPKVMGQDKVFLHVYQQYVAGDKPKASWLNERQIKIITERAYMVMANQLGEKAWDMALVDTAGRMRNLYSIKGDYTIVSFWDVHCGKCKEDMPKLDTLYRTKWKGKKVNVYAVMVNESALADWKPFIRKLSPAWIHVHQTDGMRKEEESAGKPNFRQLYDMRSTPTLFLLDSEMRIIAKNISVNDLDKLLQQKLSEKKPS